MCAATTGHAPARRKIPITYEQPCCSHLRSLLEASTAQQHLQILMQD